MTKFRLLTTAEVATLTGVSVKTVVRWVAAGDLTPATKLPGLRGAFLFDPATVNRFRTKVRFWDEFDASP